jgi:SAM-dependent methyltransferase
MARESGGQSVVLGDAGALPLAAGCADLAIAFMSLQDVGDLDRAVVAVARVLDAGGRFCIAIAHPLRSAGGFHTKEAGSPFQLDSYFDARPWNWSSQHTGMRITLPGVHRPLEAYTRALEQGGFSLEVLREPRPTKHQVARYPESARWLRIPCFLHLRAIKTSSSSSD